ncbi:hypothetical protein KP509_04G002400 [Ceratopteris richardii]|uniref:ATPase AAA-type core domain-containing protein n=1 Tax=Ceratopteris richardii TaxID=49495 RepID=A0A8T2UW51_CERRI|nr:hypothetical protein KP509_04G002400 [Ceratopteris richardii]
MASDMDLDARKGRADEAVASHATRSEPDFQQLSPMAPPFEPPSRQSLLLPPHSPIEKVAIAVEVCLKPSSSACHDEITSAVERLLAKRSLTYMDGPVVLKEGDDPFLCDNVQSICICDTGNEESADGLGNDTVLLFWQVTLNIFVYQFNDEGPGEELDDSEGIPNFQDWILPAKEFDGLWESLIFDTTLKRRLIRYAEVALLFSETAVNPNMISWNRYGEAQLVEINAHSLFSKWFSESGKMVTKLFQKIHSFVEEGDTLIFLLLDEVESLASARHAALSGSEPSDSIRVVNALLTQLDKLKAFPNVIVLTTSNVTGAIDIAFVDRADIKAFVGLPSLWARYEILRSCIKELIRVGLLSTAWEGSEDLILEFTRIDRMNCCIFSSGAPLNVLASKLLLETAQKTEGLSCRALRKLPFLAYTMLRNVSKVDLLKYLECMEAAAKKEMTEISELK